MKPQATLCPVRGRARLMRIIGKYAIRRGIHLDGGIELRGGHWCVSRNGLWVRTTDLLRMEVVV
ncbi:MAG TPA: hypothetical protein VFW88_06880 [Burkholderiales bacterium]|nr:hypothetical protein [Burkholderiales bacterium]